MATGEPGIFDNGSAAHGGIVDFQDFASEHPELTVMPNRVSWRVFGLDMGDQPGLAMIFVIELPDRNLATREMVLDRRWREPFEGRSSTEPGEAKSLAEEVRVVAVCLYRSSAVGDAEQLALPVFFRFEEMDLHWEPLKVFT